MSEYFGHYLNPNSPEEIRKREAERKKKQEQDRSSGYYSSPTDDTPSPSFDFGSSSSCDSGGCD